MSASSRLWLYRIGFISAILFLAATIFASGTFVIAIKPEKHTAGKTPADYGLDYERVTLSTEDGLELIGWFIPAAGTSGVDPKVRGKRPPTIVVGHGYPYDKSAVLEPSRFLHRDFNLFYFDFRYFGESQGTFCSFGYHETKDVAAALQHLKTRPEVDPDRIGLYGFSLSAATFILAQPQEARAMVLDSAFESIESLSVIHYRYLPRPLRWLMVRYSDWMVQVFLHHPIADAAAIRYVGRLRCPVLFIHGQEDALVPVSSSVHLHAACGSTRKELWLVPGVGHNGTFAAANRPAYQKRLLDFFHAHLDGTTR